MRQLGGIGNLWLDDRRILRLVLLTFALVIVVGISFGAYYYWDRYVHLGDQSPVDLAEQHLQQQVRENPQDPGLRVALASLYFKDGKTEQAIDQAHQVLEKYPEDGDALLILGLSYTQLGEVLSAVGYLEEFADLHRSSPMKDTDLVLETALYYLGQNYLAQNQPLMAEMVLREALGIERTDADAIYLLGQAYAQQNKPELAIEQYHNAVRFVPDFAEAYHAMAESYFNLGKHDYANYALGAQAYSLGDNDKALEYLLVSVEGSPDFAPSQLTLGLTYEKIGDLEKAKGHVTRSFELDPSSYVAEHALGRIKAVLETGK